jgi:chemotaxis protein MotB
VELTPEGLLRPGQMENVRMNRCLFAASTILALFALGCGHSEDEWKAQLDKYNKLQTSCDSRSADLDKQLAEAKQKVADLENQLKSQGLEASKMNATLADREKALKEYQARAKQLEAIKARFELLKKKLDELTKLGLAVNVRRNRMVISLPGDVLFDTGKDTLSKQGEDILKKVATVIKNDRSLADRDYQVAGHTDNQPIKGGAFKDNWALSLMRARSVLIFLLGKDGSMPKAHWSAAGFADTDPVANNAAKDGQQKNRRCDIIVVPDVDEMLDLNKLAQ